MPKRKESKKQRKSGFNPNRPNYLTADGLSYCYTVTNPESGEVVTMKLRVGVDITVEMAHVLDEMDHEQDLSDRREMDHRDQLFDSRPTNAKDDPDDDNSGDPMDGIADKSGGPEDILFSEAEPENPLIAQVRKVIDEDCTESQQDLFFRHFGEGAQLEELRQEEAERTGTKPSSQAFSNRKNKIVDKAAKALGVERVKRRKPSKKD